MRSEGYLLFKYALSSLSATAVDFGIFYLFFLATAHGGRATLAGWWVGAIVAFFLQRYWVFDLSPKQSWHSISSKYGIGLLLSMGLNVGGVWLACDEMGWSPWFSRVGAAVFAWYIVYLFNRHFVFTETNRF